MAAILLSFNTAWKDTALPGSFACKLPLRNDDDRVSILHVNIWTQLLLNIPTDNKFTSLFLNIPKDNKLKWTCTRTGVWYMHVL